ncbi:MAG: hypothetical protein HYZ28_06735 [Myxococcales bacterium]|nr:hypothetical protein [Myxococcales bacterium]
MSFDLLPPVEPPFADSTPSVSLVSVRRTMLTVHQSMGMATFALLAATVAVGHLNYHDRFYGSDRGSLERAHRALAYTTETAFLATGALALFAPEPDAKPALSGFDSTTVHKLAMLAATLCMVGQVGLGLYTASREGYVDQLTMARAHLVAG